MKPHVVVYLLTQVVQSMRANRLVHTIGMGTMVVSLLIFGFFLLFFTNLQNWVQGWGDTFFVTVYVKNDDASAARKEIEKYIDSVKGARIVREVSSKEALEILKRALGPESKLVEQLEVNPLPLALDVAFTGNQINGAALQDFREHVESLAGVDEVVLSEDWRGRARGVMGTLKVGGVVLGGILAVGVLFIVVNTIKLAIYSRRDEIEILKLVGATDWFVKAPFLLEGLVQGMLSGVVALLVLYGCYSVLAANEIQLFGFSVLEPVFIARSMVVSMFWGSAALGVLGSLIAVSRFFGP